MKVGTTDLSVLAYCCIYTDDLYNLLFTASVTLTGTYMYNNFYGHYMVGVMETQRARNVCFTSHFSTTHISVQIVTRDDTAIGMFNN